MENTQGLICNSGRWWNCTADFCPKFFSPNVVELSGTAFRLANWMRCQCARTAFYVDLPD